MTSGLVYARVPTKDLRLETDWFTFLANPKSAKNQKKKNFLPNLTLKVLSIKIFEGLRSL